MPERQLLSTTVLSSSPIDPSLSLVAIRDMMLDLVADAQIIKAIRLYRHIFFCTPFSLRSDRAKRCVLRALWQAIESHENDDFIDRLEGNADLLEDSSDRDWEMSEQDRLLTTAIEHVMYDAEVQRVRDIEFGQCVFMINSMCSPAGLICESSLISIEDMLS